jgi:putative membrane protein
MQPWFYYWNLDWIMITFILVLCAGYWYVNYFLLKKQTAYFLTGVFLIIMCTLSPLHFLGENYLFSMHMVTHTIILLIAAPLVLAGIPTGNRFKKHFDAISKTSVKYPFLFWISGIGIMWFWHVPFIFNQMFSMNGMTMGSMNQMGFLHYFHIVSLLIAGMLFAWPVIRPDTNNKFTAPACVLYLTSACIGCSLLGLMITFAPLGTYPHYVNVHDIYGFLPTIRNSWNISAAMDQQMAGLIMWVPCCFVYLSVSMVILIKWFNERQPATSTQLIKF